MLLNIPWKELHPKLVGFGLGARENCEMVGGPHFVGGRWETIAMIWGLLILNQGIFLSFPIFFSLFLWFFLFLSFSDFFLDLFVYLSSIN